MNSEPQTAAKQQQQTGAIARIRHSIGRTIGIADEAVLTDDQVAEAVTASVVERSRATRARRPVNYAEGEGATSVNGAGGSGKTS